MTLKKNVYLAYAEITPMSARLTVRKQSDDLSSTDSALGRSSAVTCTTARDTQFSEVSWVIDQNALNS